MRIGINRLGLAALLLASSLARGATLVYTGTLTGAAEAPPNASTGTGSTTVTYDSAAHTLQVDISFANLTSTTTAAHIHCCTATPGTGTAVEATQTPSFTGFPPGVTSGTYLSPVFDLTSATSWNAAFITANGETTALAEAAFAAGLAAGTSYLDIHTVVFGGGEIRSFLARLSPVTSQRFTIERGARGADSQRSARADPSSELASAPRSDDPEDPTVHEVDSLGLR